MREKFGEPGNGMTSDAGENILEPDEWIDSYALTGSHEAAQDCGRLAAFITAKENPVLTAHCYAADRALGGVMPLPGLCRVWILGMLRFGRISDLREYETRHNHRPSKKASSESVGWKRSGVAPDGAACPSAFSLSCISAWR